MPIGVGDRERESVEKPQSSSIGLAQHVLAMHIFCDLGPRQLWLLICAIQRHHRAPSTLSDAIEADDFEESKIVHVVKVGFGCRDAALP